jgi:chromosome segregation ATPase
VSGASAKAVRLAVPPAIVAPEPGSLEHWKQQALAAGERLTYAENQLKDLRTSTDEMRARMSKATSRLDSAQERVNELQAELIRVCAERDALAARVLAQEDVKRRLWELRADVHARFWDVFSDL